MIIGLGIDAQWIDDSIELVPETIEYSEKHSAQVTVQNHATIVRFKEQYGHSLEEITGLVIPQSKSNEDVDFNFRSFIAHIRVDENHKLARLPILVVGKNENEPYKLVQEEIYDLFYKHIAVDYTDLTGPAQFNNDFDEDKFEAFCYEAGQRPKSGSSRHDQANIWGAFSMSWFLSIAKPSSVNTEAFDELKSRLCEDVFYKIKIQQLEGHQPRKELLDSFGTERRTLLDNQKGSGSILVVDDQLKDGWRIAYETLFKNSAGEAHVVFAENESEALRLFDSETKLVLLDVRLAQDRNRNSQFETDDSVDEYGGVKLAEKLWSKELAVPIVAATASNKSWTLRALLDKGVSSYWVKEMPVHADSAEIADSAASNVIDLSRKLNETLEWSNLTRGWIEAGYSIYKAVNKDKPTIGKQLKDKAESLHALLHREPSPFSQSLSGGLQLNLAFLALFSMMNDLVWWICKSKNEGGRTTWFTDFHGNQETLVVEQTVGGSQKYDTRFLNPAKRDFINSQYFPDTDVAMDVLFRLGLKSEVRDFEKIRNIRNRLPQIHGKPTTHGSNMKPVKKAHPDDIKLLVNVLNAMVRRYSGMTQT